MQGENVKVILKIGFLSTLLLVLVSAARADTITLNSNNGSSSNHANGALEYMGYSALNANFLANTPALPNYVPLSASATPSTNSTSQSTYAIPAGGWATAIAGTSWVSNTSSAGTTCTNGTTCDPNDFYYYQTTFNAVGGGYNGSISVMADDTAEVLLNGVVIVPFAIVGGDGHCASGNANGTDAVPSCGAPDEVSFSSISLLSGTNTLTIIDAQTDLNGAGVDFKAQFTEAPEPSSLLLLGTGLLGLAFVVFRKNKPLDRASNSQV